MKHREIPDWLDGSRSKTVPPNASLLGATRTQSAKMKVTFSTTLYPVTLPLSMVTS